VQELCHFNVVEDAMKKERLCEKDTRILLLKLITYDLGWRMMTKRKVSKPTYTRARFSPSDQRGMSVTKIMRMESRKA